MLDVFTWNHWLPPPLDDFHVVAISSLNSDHCEEELHVVFYKSDNFLPDYDPLYTEFVRLFYGTIYNDNFKLLEFEKDDEEQSEPEGIFLSTRFWGWMLLHLTCLPVAA